MSRHTASDEASWREAFERLGTHTVRSRSGIVEMSFDASVPDIVQTEPHPPRWIVKGWPHEKELADARGDDQRHTHRHRVLIAHRGLDRDVDTRVAVDQALVSRLVGGQVSNAYATPDSLKRRWARRLVR